MKRVGNITKVDQISILLSFLSKVLEVLNLLLLVLVKLFPVKTGNHLFAWWQRKEEHSKCAHAKQNKGSLSISTGSLIISLCQLVMPNCTF